jgi:spore germination protein KC
MRKKCILLVIIITMQFLTGCKDAMEIDNIAIIIGIGLDKTDNDEVVLSLLLPVTRYSEFGGLSSGGPFKSEATILVSEKGRGIMDAYRKIEKKLSRKIFFSQNEVIFIGESLAREGVLDVIDFFYRHPESRLRSLDQTKETKEKLIV